MQFDHLVRIRNSQKGLPIWQHKEEILAKIKANQVVIVAGDTGCGKSTQVYFELVLVITCSLSPPSLRSLSICCQLECPALLVPSHGELPVSH